MTIARCAKTSVTDVNAQRRQAAEVAPLEPIDWLLLVVPGVVWGSSFYFIAVGLESFAPGLITPMRVLFGCLTLTFIPQSRRPVERAAWPMIAVLAVVWMAIPLTVFPFAEQHVSSSVTGMLNGATPIFAAAVAAVIAVVRPVASTGTECHAISLARGACEDRAQIRREPLGGAGRAVVRQRRQRRWLRRPQTHARTG